MKQAWPLVLVCSGVIPVVVYCAEPYLSLAREQPYTDVSKREAKLPDDGKGRMIRCLNTHEIATQVASPSTTIDMAGKHYPIYISWDRFPGV